VGRLLFQCFRLELPLDLAPTMNEYARARPWDHARVQDAVDAAVLAARARWSGWHAGFTERAETKRRKPTPKNPATSRIFIRRTGGRRRLVRVARESSREPDELTCDVLGGKVPIDRLVQAGVLVGDSRKWIEREGVWRPANPKQGRVIFEVFDIREEVDP